MSALIDIIIAVVLGVAVLVWLRQLSPVPRWARLLPLAVLVPAVVVDLFGGRLVALVLFGLSALLVLVLPVLDLVLRRDAPPVPAPRTAGDNNGRVRQPARRR